MSIWDGQPQELPRTPVEPPMPAPIPCWVCGQQLTASEPMVRYDGVEYFLASARTAGFPRRASHLRCSPDPNVMDAGDRIALDAGINPWRERRRMLEAEDDLGGR